MGIDGNLMVLGVVELLAEGMTFADKTGVGADLLRTFIEEFMPTASFLGCTSLLFFLTI